jgi:hypothetical protein
MSYDHGCNLANQFCLEPNDYKVLLILTSMALYTRLCWRDERQRDNQLDNRQERGMMLVVLAGSGGMMAQLAVSSP